MAAVFGDEIQTRARSLVYDMASPSEMMLDLITHAGEDKSGLARARAVVAVLAGGRRGAELNFRTGCEVADVIVERLRMSESVRDSLRSPSSGGTGEVCRRAPGTTPSRCPCAWST